MERFKCNRIFLLIVVLLLSLCAKSQDSIPMLLDSIDKVYIKALYPKTPETDWAQVNKTNNFGDGLSLNENIANHVPVFFKNYGAGQLSSISVNGLSATQTNVEWNGLRLNSAMLGQVDFSIIPTSNNDAVSLNSTLDNLGGTIALSNQLELRQYWQKDEWQLNSGMHGGSFGQFSVYANYSSSHKKIASQTGIQFKRATNNFKYKNSTGIGIAEQRLTNAKINQLAWNQSLIWKIKKMKSWLHFMQQFSEREIPPTLVQTSSTASQGDQLNAVIGGMQGNLNFVKRSSVSYEFTSGYQHQKIDFSLSEFGAPEISATGSWQNKLVLDQSIDRRRGYRFSHTIQHTLEHGSIDAYESTQTRNYGLWNSEAAILLKKKSTLTFGLGKSIYRPAKSPILPSIQYQKFIHYLPASVMIQARYGRHFRIPTMNDLYWVPGGNLDLEPELSHDFQATMKLWKTEGTPVNIKLNAFFIWADNYIQWQPTSNGYWSPFNVGSIVSRGASLDLTSQRTLLNLLTIKSAIKYQYTRTTRKGENQQLLYTPFHQLVWKTDFVLKMFELNTRRMFTSRVTTSESSASILKGYYLSDIGIAVNLKGKGKFQNEYKLNFMVNNIGNNTYQTVVNRPMMGRSYELKLSVKLIGEKNE